MVDLEAIQILWKLRLTSLGSGSSNKNNGNAYYKYKLLEKKLWKFNLEERVQWVFLEHRQWGRGSNLEVLFALPHYSYSNKINSP